MNKLSMELYHRSPKFIQTIGINIFELQERRLRKSNKFYNWTNLLRKTESWRDEDFIRYQNRHLKNIVEYAYKYVPFYHKLYKENGIDISKIQTIDDLEKLPIIKKEDIIKYSNSFLSTKKEKFITRHTSGTTGKPLKARISYNSVVLDKANAYRRDIWARYDGGWTARFVGDTPVKDCNDKTLFRKSYTTKRVIFPSYCLSLEKLPYILNTLKKQNIEFIQTYPSTAFILAKFLEMSDTYLPLKAVLYSSEPMYDFQRELIEERFKTKVFGFYGQAEGVISALECEKREYHLTMVDGVLEIVKDGKRISQGEKGFSVVTSLHNYAMPLIRYALNDYTGYKNKTCNCDRTSPLIYPIETKLEDFVITPSGKILSPSLLTFPLKDARNVIESQIIQKTIDSIIIKIVPAEGYTNSDELAILNSFKQLLGAEMSIKIEDIKKIYQTKAYKKRFVVNELGGDYVEKAFGKLE